MMKLLLIVEGHGDQDAVRLLARRVLHELHGRYDVELLPPQRRGEWPKVKQEFQRFYLSARLESAPILWALDFDCSDCLDHEQERAWGLGQAASLDSTGSIDFVFFVKEFESLFLWEKPPLEQGFNESLAEESLPADPENIRDAKGYVSALLPKGRAYKPTTDQARIAQRLDLKLLLEKSLSFRRFEQALRDLTSTVAKSE